jgi:calcineurin-like phosphoesterase family protein
MFFFTSDEHYGHANVLKYNDRPYSNVAEMDEGLIKNFNSVVTSADVTVHAGDFCWCNHKEDVYKKYVRRLNGTHILLVGSHDHWQPESGRYIWHKTIDGIFVVVCHYCMLTWERSHYNSWQLFGHSHGRLVRDSKQHDVGVDNNNYFPVSFEQLKVIMANKPNNPNYIEKREVRT